MAIKIIHPMNAEGNDTLVDNTKVVTPLMLSEERAIRKAFSEEDLQNEFDFYMAEKLSKMMLEKGLLSEEECTKLSVKNRETFSPYLCSIMSKSA